MPIATVCPECNSMFRTPVEALRRADGTVQCGGCSCVFVGLKHALLLDSPIVEQFAPTTMELKAKRNWGGAVLAAGVIATVFVAAAVSHLGLAKNAFSLEYAQMVSPAYKLLGVPQPVYTGIDAFVLGQSTLRKDVDDSIRLSFSLDNQTALQVAWPKLRVQLLGADGQTTYEVVTNVRDLGGAKSASEVAPRANLVLEAHVSAANAKNAVTYKLEVVEQ